MKLEFIISMALFSLLGTALPIWGMIALRRDAAKKYFLGATLLEVASETAVSEQGEVDLDFLETDQTAKMCRSLFMIQENGLVVFSLGPLRQAYLVDSTATAERLYKKFTQYYYWLCGVTMFFLVILGAKFVARPPVFIGFMGGMMLLQNVLLFTLFSKDLSTLQKVEKKHSIGMWLAGMGQGLSRQDVLIRLGGSIAVVLGSVWMMTMKGSEFIAWASIVIFTVSSIVWLAVLLINKEAE